MKVKINNQTYTIKEVDDIGLISNESENIWGQCKYEDCEILIKKSLNLIRKKETLYHELTHAFMFEYGLSQANLTSEIVCDFIGAFGERMTEIVNKYFDKKQHTELS